jgi:hypothetical protein
LPKEGLHFLSNWEENIAAKLVVPLEDLNTDILLCTYEIRTNAENVLSEFNCFQTAITYRKRP